MKDNSLKITINHYGEESSFTLPADSTLDKVLEKFKGLLITDEWPVELVQRIQLMDTAEDVVPEIAGVEAQE